MNSASASQKTSQNKACLSSANSDLALEQKLLLLANSYKELERNKVPFTDLVYRKFLISLKDLQIQAIDIFPTMNSLWRRIKNEDSLEPKITNRDLSKNKVLPKKNPILIEEKLKRTENNDRVLWQSPEGDWKVQSAFKTPNDTFKTNFLVYEDTSYKLSDQLSQYFREGFTYKSQLLVRAAPESALDINQDTFYLFEYKDGKISKSLTQKVFKATKDFYFMFQNTQVPSIVKHTPSIGTYEYTHFELKTILSSELDSYLKLGNSVVFVFKPSYINSSSTEIAIFDFDGANYVQREFTANNAKFKKINY
ncbi:MAG: hypothetical protein VX642_11030, partial [Bdellovibrionota bacterium]|nr:hypothetical protein [Bdellovibrionota bacterium]